MQRHDIRGVQPNQQGAQAPPRHCQAQGSCEGGLAHPADPVPDGDHTQARDAGHTLAAGRPGHRSGDRFPQRQGVAIGALEQVGDGCVPDEDLLDRWQGLELVGEIPDLRIVVRADRGGQDDVGRSGDGGEGLEQHLRSLEDHGIQDDDLWAVAELGLEIGRIVGESRHAEAGIHRDGLLPGQ